MNGLCVCGKDFIFGFTDVHILSGRTLRGGPEWQERANSDSDLKRRAGPHVEDYVRVSGKRARLLSLTAISLRTVRL